MLAGVEEEALAAARRSRLWRSGEGVELINVCALTKTEAQPRGSCDLCLHAQVL